MQTIQLEVDSDDVLTVVVTRGGEPISEHTLHALGTSGSLAHFKGGPQIGAQAAIGTQPARCRSNSSQ